MGTTAGDISFDELKRMTQSHLCAQCEGALALIWNGLIDDYELVCGRDHSHQGYRAIISLSQTVARGQGDKVLGTGAQQDMEEQSQRRGAPINNLPTHDIGTMTKLVPLVVAELKAYATSLGLFASLGHVCLYHGKPYITIDGYYYQLNKRTPNVKIGTRPCTTEEHKALNAAEDDIWWIAESWLGTTKLPTVGYGLVTANEQTEKSERHPGEFRAPVVHSHPQRMAEKRAEWQLLRKLVPLEIEQ